MVVPAHGLLEGREYRHSPVQYLSWHLAHLVVKSVSQVFPPPLPLWVLKKLFRLFSLITLPHEIFILIVKDMVHICVGTVYIAMFYTQKD